eukprot:m.431443 g.431443  ORF g.431443 m.431443 type:complete len:331 (+) comp17306_c0_seq1:52-1044(+)
MKGNEASGVGWLILYIFLNLMVTFLNKGLFQTYGWPYPTVLALWHYVCTSVGSFIVVNGFKAITPAKLERKDHMTLFAFSLLFNVNIWLSNYSLNLVTMAMHQVVRALVPAFTVMLSIPFLGKTYSTKTLATLILIFFGVCLYAGEGDVGGSNYGIALTLVGAFLAAAKGVVTNLLMVGRLKLHPFDLVRYTSTYSAIVLFAVVMYTGTLQESMDNIAEREPGSGVERALIVNGLGAYFLNIVSFVANKSTSPLAMNVGGITKQVLAIILGIVLFGTVLSPQSQVGVVVVIAGVILYSRVSFLESNANKVEKKELPTQMAPIGQVDVESK